MPEGSCVCGATRIAFTGEPMLQALCHCSDCRKITGSTYSTNVVVPGEGFAVTAGTPKLFAKKGDSGAEVVSHFCDTCGTTLFRDGASFGESKVVKAGVLEGKGVLDGIKPGVELFVAQRAGWVAPVEGASQKVNMPGSEDA